MKLFSFKFCGIESWLSFYRLSTSIIVPSVTSLVANVCLLIRVRSSSRRVRAQSEVSRTNPQDLNKNLGINQRDRALLKNTFFMLIIFILGWAPIFLLVSLDYGGHVQSIFYFLLQISASLSSVIWMIDLFFCHREMRIFFKEKLCFCR